VPSEREKPLPYSASDIFDFCTVPIWILSNRDA
jgi:hypothetical protein